MRAWANEQDTLRQEILQRRGVGRAVMSEGLRRLRHLGATTAYVGSRSVEAGAFYASVGLAEYDLLVPWVKELA